MGRPQPGVDTLPRALRRHRSGRYLDTCMATTATLSPAVGEKEGHLLQGNALPPREPELERGPTVDDSPTRRERAGGSRRGGNPPLGPKRNLPKNGLLGGPRLTELPIHAGISNLNYRARRNIQP